MATVPVWIAWIFISFLLPFGGFRLWCGAAEDQLDDTLRRRRWPRLRVVGRARPQSSGGSRGAVDLEHTVDALEMPVNREQALENA
jgi:hypothetical protein